jgi:hypothetical protein
MLKKIERLIDLWRRVNSKRDRDIEYLKEIRGVQLRLGFLKHQDDLCFCGPEDLEQEIAWELGIEPDSDVAGFISMVKGYLENRSKECN